MFFFAIDKKLVFPEWYYELEPEYKKAVLELTVAEIGDGLGLFYANHTLYKAQTGIYSAWLKSMVKELASDPQFVNWVYNNIIGIPTPHYEGWSVVLVNENKIAILPGAVQWICKWTSLSNT